MAWKKTNFRPWISQTICAVLVSACAVEKPFGESIDDVNLSGPQTPARIQLSDAQVFSREALLNDRIREVKFIGDLVNENVRNQFKSQLQRDLTHITTMAAQLGIGFNPAVGAQNEQALERNERLHDIEMQRLDIELKRLENELDKLERGEAVEAQSTGDPRTLAAPPTADTGKAITQLKELTSQVIGLLGKEFRKSKTDLSPEHTYRDWQAYRAELRADEQAAKLDDIHDANGNTLYRMQFTATVLPGSVTDKFGIAMVDVNPPKFDENTLEELYYDWLKHVNARLNRVTSNGIVPDPFYQRLGKKPTS